MTATLTAVTHERGPDSVDHFTFEFVLTDSWGVSVADCLPLPAIRRLAARSDRNAVFHLARAVAETSAGEYATLIGSTFGDDGAL